MVFAETVFISATAWVELALPIISTIAGTFSVAYSLRFTVDVFFGPTANDLPHPPHEPPRWMRAPVELLVFACLLVGIFPAQVVGSLLAAAALPVVGGPLPRSEEHTSELQSLMRRSYAVFCLKKKKN